jgi:hypothetical protein
MPCLWGSIPNQKEIPPIQNFCQAGKRICEADFLFPTSVKFNSSFSESVSSKYFVTLPQPFINIKKKNYDVLFLCGVRKSRGETQRACLFAWTRGWAWL